MKDYLLRVIIALEERFHNTQYDKRVFVFLCFCKANRELKGIAANELYSKSRQGCDKLIYVGLAERLLKIAEEKNSAKQR